MAGQIKVSEWDSEIRREFRGHNFRVVSLVFLQDEKTLVSASHESVRIWDLETGRQRFALKPTDPLKHMTISPDEAVIAAGTGGGAIRLFRRSVKEEVEAAGW
jgi:WD40 repeat protein